MPAIEGEIDAAKARMSSLREAGHAVAVRYDRRHRTIAVTLHTGVRLVVPVRLLQGLADAPSRSLAEVEISPSGLGLHWPSIDADVYVPGLLGGVFGSKAWMAALDAAPSLQGGEGRRSA